jgi:hypothetical protein
VFIYFSFDVYLFRNNEGLDNVIDDGGLLAIVATQGRQRSHLPDRATATWALARTTLK